MCRFIARCRFQIIFSVFPSAFTSPSPPHSRHFVYIYIGTLTLRASSYISSAFAVLAYFAKIWQRHIRYLLSALGFATTYCPWNTNQMVICFNAEICSIVRYSVKGESEIKISLLPYFSITSFAHCNAVSLSLQLPHTTQYASFSFLNSHPSL